MSDGLKTGLIVAGVAVVGYFLYSRMSSAASLAAGTVPLGPQLSPAGSPTAPAPGAVSAASVSKSVGSYVGSYAANAGLAFATGGTSLLFTTSAGKAITSGVVSGVKSAASSVYDAGSSVVHDVFSLF